MTEELAVPKIVVVGVGGAGCNSVNRMSHLGIKGAELVAVNTDRQHFQLVSDAVTKILIGKSVTRGLGAGGDPAVGEKAAEVSRQVLEEVLSGANLVFLVAGMGGGTGTGASPVIARIAKEQGAIVISMVTYPFRLERNRLRIADEGLEKLSRYSDTVIVIDNNRLVELFPNLPMDDAFAVADEVIARAVTGITETITQPSFINLDYADVRAVMSQGGLSVISVGEGRGPDRVNEAVDGVLHNRLLDVDISGAKGVLIYIKGGTDLTLGEANKIGELLTTQVDPDANVIWGANVTPELNGMVQVIAIFTSVSSPHVFGRKEEEDLGLEFI